MSFIQHLESITGASGPRDHMYYKKLIQDGLGVPLDRISTETHEQIYDSISSKLRLFGQKKRVAILSQALGGSGDIMNTMKFIDTMKSVGEFDFRVYVPVEHVEQYNKYMNKIYGDIVRPINKKDPWETPDKHELSLLMSDLVDAVCPDLFIVIPLSYNAPEEPSRYIPHMKCPSSLVKLAFEYNSKTFTKSKTLLTGIYIDRYLYHNKEPSKQIKAKLINKQLRKVMQVIKNPPFFGYASHQYMHMLYMMVVLLGYEELHIGSGDLNFVFVKATEYPDSFLHHIMSFIKHVFLPNTSSMKDCMEEIIGSNAALRQRFGMNDSIVINPLYAGDLDNQTGRLYGLKRIYRNVNKYKNINYYLDGELIDTYEIQSGQTGQKGHPKQQTSININTFSRLDHDDMLQMHLLSHPFTMVTGDQSLFEALSRRGKVPFYEKQTWKADLAQGLLDIVTPLCDVKYDCKIEAAVRGLNYQLLNNLARKDIFNINNALMSDLQVYFDDGFWYSAYEDQQDIQSINLFDLLQKAYGVLHDNLDQYSIRKNIVELVDKMVPYTPKVRKEAERIYAKHFKSYTDLMYKELSKKKVTVRDVEAGKSWDIPYSRFVKNNPM